MTARREGYAVIVTFTVEPAYRKAFRDAVLENAFASRTLEPGCSVFDVCESEDGSKVILYEIYDSEAALREHLATDHFRSFDALVAPWVVDKRITTYHRLANE
jgi:(4S)-4-hydroxy-5-phosphonooxypentane-2,3-dione isomerase